MGADAKKAKGVDVEGAAAGVGCAGPEITHATAEAEDKVPVVVESAFSP